MIQSSLIHQAKIRVIKILRIRQENAIEVNMQRLHFFIFIILLLASCSPMPQTTPDPTKPSAFPLPLPSVTATRPPAIDYLNSDLPGSTPQRFGEDFFSGSFHSAPVFSPDGLTVWWAGEYGTATIYTSHFSTDSWSDPAIVTFSEDMRSYRDPFISPDGKIFYFISEDPIPGSTTGRKENIWLMQKTTEGWSDPQPLPTSINDLALHWTVSVAENYNLYFSAQKDGNTDIFLSRYIEGTYSDPIQLDAPINTANIEITPNIAPDESYLLFTRIASRSDPPHLYISYKQESGWSEPVRVENIDYCISPIITPDRSFVIYLSSPSSFEWRDTSFIEAFRP
jgi:hypothetical protein